MMQDDLLEAVYDCVVYLQALINPSGPAGACVQYLLDGQVRVYASDYVLDEIVDVARRPSIATKFGIGDEDIARFLDPVIRRVEFVDSIGDSFQLSADPDDAHYVNLAIAAGAGHIVSRDMHLLRLGDESCTEGVDFRARYPQIRILSPPQFLVEVRARVKPA
jgi:putative PIN family toxin of toxin-antitoxin system